MSDKVALTDTLRVSVIMGVYKESPSECAAAIQNMLDQTLSPLEVVVVVDDPENVAVREMLEKWQAREARLRVVVHEENRGLGAALNTAAREARGQWLARMDVNDEAAADRLAKQVEHIEQHPDTDLLFTQWRERYEDGSTAERRPARSDVRNIHKNFFIKSILLHPTLLIRREIIRTHSYPEMARPEDFVLFLELIRTGYHFDLVPEILYTYSVDRSERYQKIRTYSRNLLPQLARNIRYYWSNIWFWFYLLRITGEYLVSRNRTIFNLTHRTAARAWKAVSRG